MHRTTGPAGVGPLGLALSVAACARHGALIDVIGENDNDVRWLIPVGGARSCRWLYERALASWAGAKDGFVLRSVSVPRLFVVVAWWRAYRRCDGCA